jgi:glycosyltransferase involved in cell wall biosynthesis
MVSSFILINYFLNFKLKKILFYFNSLQPSGGIERVIVTLANKLCLQYEVTILVKDPPISFYQLDKNVKLLSLGNQVSFNMNSKFSRFFTAIKSVLKNTISLKKFLRNNIYDYYYLPHPLNVLEFHLARGVHQHNTIISEHGASNAYNIIYRKIKIWLYHKAKAYIVPTTTDSEFYNTIKIPAQYLPHFKSDLPYIKSNLTENIALSIGRFTDVKQQIILLETWNSLINFRKIHNWKLYIVGSGELKYKFEDYIKKNKLQDFVFLFPPISDISFYYKQASLFLLTSKSEGFGMVLLEAISFGLPCISFDCPSGPRDIIQNGENGYLITENNQVEFERSIIKFISNPILKYEMSIKSLALSSNWDDEKLLKQWYNLLA